MQHPNPGTSLPFEQCENFRELGGYTGFGGKTVKYGVFYRTGALALVRTPHDKALLQSLGIRTVIDFRSETERAQQPDPVPEGAQYFAYSAMREMDGGEKSFDLQQIFADGLHGIQRMLEMVSQSYVTMPFGNPAYRALFKQIRAGQTPILFHCTAGKDRTGVAAALILRALGVSDADILHDYDLTNSCRKASHAQFLQQYGAFLPEEGRDELLACILGVEVENLVATLRAIDAKYPDFADYLSQECDFDADALAAMREAYL